MRGPGRAQRARATDRDDTRGRDDAKGEERERDTSASARHGRGARGGARAHRVLVGVGPQEVTEQAGVRDVRRAGEALDLRVGVDARHASANTTRAPRVSQKKKPRATCQRERAPRVSARRLLLLLLLLLWGRSMKIRYTARHESEMVTLYNGSITVSYRAYLVHLRQLGRKSAVRAEDLRTRDRVRARRTVANR